MKPPRLGADLPLETRCHRMAPTGPCLKPGKWHIIWEGRNGSNACDACAEFCRNNRKFLQVHKLVPACNAQWTLWYPEEETCRHPRNEVDLISGQVVLFR